MEDKEVGGKDFSEDREEEEDVDPRVQVELEELNTASNKINVLETELENQRSAFRSLLSESTQSLNQTCKKLGKCINRSRPYYELLKDSRRAQAEAQRAAVDFQRAHGIYQAAKETVSLAEERLMTEDGSKWEFDSAWQEMLNHATMKFMESEKTKATSEEEHCLKAAEYAAIQQKLMFLEKDIPRSISRARPYFDVKEQLEYQLQAQRQSVEDTQQLLADAKEKYRASLNKLESISEEIHQRRKPPFSLPPRTPGVGAESCHHQADLPSINLDSFSLSETASQFSYDEQSLVSEQESPKNCDIRSNYEKRVIEDPLRRSGIGAYLAQRNSFSEGGCDSSDSSPQSSPILGGDRQRRRRKKLQTSKAFPILQGLTVTSKQMSPRLMRASATQGRFEAVVIENDGSPKQYRNQRALPWQQDTELLRRMQVSSRTVARKQMIATEVPAEVFENASSPNRNKDKNDDEIFV